jgi:hypothetical protein
MHPFALVIEQFEGERRNLQWLTPITMGYIYTITGVWWQFVLTIVAIGGARFATDLGKEVRNGDRTYTELIKSGTEVPIVGGVVLIILGTPYAISMVSAPYLLYQHFDHTNLILVGLAAIYWGVAIILLQILLYPEI